MIDIEIKNVYKGYDGNRNIIKGINLTVKKGELITLLGPSGCGKTTLLKMLNKLVDIDEGDILKKLNPKTLLLVLQLELDQMK